MASRGRPRTAVHTVDKDLYERVLSDSVRHGILIDPHLSDLDAARIEPDALERLGQAVLQLLSRYRQESTRPTEVAPRVSLSDTYLQGAVHESLLSTSLVAAEEMTGNLLIGLPQVEEAVRRINNFCNVHGVRGLIRVYWVATSYENYLCLGYYGEVVVEDFRSGRLHRPWADYRLTEEEDLARRLNHVRTARKGAKEVLSLTEEGQKTLASLLELLESSSVLHYRRSLRYQSLYDRHGLAQDATTQLFPGMKDARMLLLKETGVGPGQTVLELGPGVGALTIDAGLLDLLGPSGHLVAMDLSRGALRILESRLAPRAIQPRLVHGRAEEISYPEATFDLVVGSFFLHFTQVPEALSEIWRVLRPGGRAGLLLITTPREPHPLFQAIGAEAASFGRARSMPQWADYRHAPGEVRALTEGLGAQILVNRFVPVVGRFDDPERVVGLLFQSTGLFQRMLDRLPYAEALQLFRETEERVKASIESARDEDRTIQREVEILVVGKPLPV